MRNSKSELTCLKRLQVISPVYEEVVQFLLEEYLLSQEELKVLRNSPDQGKYLYSKLVSLSEERKLQMLEFEWSILPVERIKINIVSDRGFKEFSAEL